MTPLLNRGDKEVKNSDKKQSVSGPRGRAFAVEDMTSVKSSQQATLGNELKGAASWL